ncbi:MAG: hypothetical protein Tp178MES00d2C33159851_6 [Prokaryotic dsDNA virus sp.]|nr:MAG: hypothetical protein Tp178MES00d2C33159851_6 [Prokaryotic dsDNA virus sp.]|tara:strand:- start:90091 stop:90339 length:249 start_codon:yes stop_codon:yes gene_type:complete
MNGTKCDLYVYYSGKWEFDPAIPFQSRYLVYKGVPYGHGITDKDITSLVETELLPIVRKFFDADDSEESPNSLLNKTAENRC